MVDRSSVMKPARGNVPLRDISVFVLRGVAVWRSDDATREIKRCLSYEKQARKQAQIPHRSLGTTGSPKVRSFDDKVLQAEYLDHVELAPLCR